MYRKPDSVAASSPPIASRMAQTMMPRPPAGQFVEAVILRQDGRRERLVERLNETVGQMQSP